MSSVLLYSFKSEDIKITIEAYFDQQENLVIEGYDIGKTVEAYWHDSDYEYSTTIRPDEVKKLYDTLNVPAGSKKKLLSYLQAHYNTNKCYSQIQEFLTQNNILFEGFSWM